MPCGQAHFLPLPGVSKHKSLQLPLFSVQGPLPSTAEQQQQNRFVLDVCQTDRFTSHESSQIRKRAFMLLDLLSSCSVGFNYF